MLSVLFMELHNSHCTFYCLAILKPVEKRSILTSIFYRIVKNNFCSIFSRSHPRNSDGTISRTTNRVLKGHTDDVARFVVKNGLVVSGGRDQSLFGWNSITGDFLFAKRYCHGSEVSAVDVSGQGSIVVSGSRDRTVKIWSLFSNNDDCSSMMMQSNNNINNKNVNNNNGNALPRLVGTVDIGDRIW